MSDNIEQDSSVTDHAMLVVWGQYAQCLRLPQTFGVGIYENDVATLLHDYQPNISILLTELSKYVNETDLAEIKNIVADIQNRISRFENESR